MAATISSPYHFASGHIGTDQQMIMCSILQEAVLSLCQANYPKSAQLEVDAIICISVVSSAEQHVVKIHEKLNDADLNPADVSGNQNNPLNTLTKQNVIGQETVKLKNRYRGKSGESTTDVYPHETDTPVEQTSQHRVIQSRQMPGRSSLSHVQKRRFDNSENLPNKVTKNSFPKRSISNSELEPVIIKIEPDDNEEESKASSSSALVDEVQYPSIDEGSHSQPRPTALFRTDHSVKPPDDNIIVQKTSPVELFPSEQTFSKSNLELSQFSFSNRNVSSTITHENEYQTNSSHFTTDRSAFSANPKIEIQDSVVHSDQHHLVLNTSEQENSHLSTEMVQNVDEQSMYMQSVHSNEDDVQCIEDGEDVKFEEQVEASEISNTKQHAKQPVLQRKTMFCEICGKHFRSRFGLRCHLNTHNQQFKYICSICKKGFQQRWNLERHMQSHIPKTFSCDECGNTFHNYDDFYTHKFTHWNHENIITESKEKKKRKKSLVLHKNKDQIEEQIFMTKQTIPVSVEPMTDIDNSQGMVCTPAPLKTDQFLIELANIPPAQNSMASDLYTLQQNNLKQECSQENEQFGVNFPVIFHNTKDDDDSKPYLPVSNYKNDAESDNQKKTLKSLASPKDKPFACDRPSCDKTFKSKFGLQCHLNTHDGFYKYSCALCEKQYQQRSNLNEHMRIHHGAV